jgi:anti-sigma factor (TIGR02949 family)
MGKAMPPPGGIDCGGVMDQLYEYIDEELDEETIEKIRKHLAVCKRCYPRYNFEQAFLRFLGEQGRTAAPPELRRKIFASILREEREG